MLEQRSTLSADAVDHDRVMVPVVLAGRGGPGLYLHAAGPADYATGVRGRGLRRIGELGLLARYTIGEHSRSNSTNPRFSLYVVHMSHSYSNC